MCSISEGMNEAINVYDDKIVDVFIGPVCDYAVAPIARQVPGERGGGAGREWEGKRERGGGSGKGVGGKERERGVWKGSGRKRERGGEG